MDNQQNELDIRRYLQIIHKKRHLFIATAVGIITLIVAASYVIPRSYEASTTVSIEKNYLNVLMQDITVGPSVEERVHALSVVLMSRSMLLRVLADLGMSIDTKDDAEVEKLVKQFQKKTKIEIETNRSSQRNMDMFTVSYRDHDPRFARDYVNSLVNRYIVESMSSKRQEALGANRFVFEQMDLYKARIDRTETELAQRRKEQGVQLTENLAALQHRLDELLVQYTDRHPEVVRLRAEIESTRAQLQKKKDSLMDGSGSAAVALEGSAKLRPGSGKKQRSIADLERDLEAYKKIYESLVTSIGKSEMSAQVEVRAKADTFRILDPAVLPIEPVGAPRWKIILLAIAAGIGGGAASAIVLDMMDKSIKDVETLRELGLPVIGMIPRILSVESIIAARRKARLLYGAAGMYLLGIVALAAFEFLR
jgi:succinoglycan biosynthesis transport protein ExoP